VCDLGALTGIGAVPRRTGRDFTHLARPAKQYFRARPAANPPRSDSARPAKQYFRPGPGPSKKSDENVFFPKTTH
jgi:hypothetical protein